ncbi:hypothetical protein C8R48DRAFT_671390 [Suillus tomentosus]|nr:hypothetical protein C8R48DRAFT_671390 [Suillus tomentosus]
MPMGMGICLNFEDGADNLEEGEGHQDEEENDSDVEADEDEVDNPDAVIADSDEELDDNILAQEGYGTHNTVTFLPSDKGQPTWAHIMIDEAHGSYSSPGWGGPMGLWIEIHCAYRWAQGIAEKRFPQQSRVGPQVSGVTGILPPVIFRAVKENETRRRIKK